MASVKVKFRPSTVNGREGTLYYQVIHNRVVRQINFSFRNGTAIPKRLSYIVYQQDKSGTTIYFQSVHASRGTRTG